jgi:hypothetical protein
VITNTYNEGDIISGGVVGTCDIYNGLYQLRPRADLAEGTSGTPVQPIILTMAELLADFSQYQSQLIKLEEVTFAAGTFGTGAAGNINISQNSSQMICRNHFGNITGYSPNPSLLYDVAGFVIPYNADKQIAPRNLGDIAFELPQYVIEFGPSAAEDAGGSVYPTNMPDAVDFVMVDAGTDLSFSIVPAEGVRIDQVLVDNVPNPTAVTTGIYVFTNISANHTIFATFKPLSIIENDMPVIHVFSYNNKVTIENGGLVPIKQVEIMDMHGRMIWKGQANDVKTEITLNVSIGIYNVRIITGNNQQITTKVVIN